MKFLPRVFAVFVAAAVTVSAAGGPASAVPKKPDEKTILHVLNRIGFGARPGDVERVRAIGLDKYIEAQLHPEKIADPQMAPRLASFETVTKSSRELAEDYYIPAQMARQQAQRQAGRNGQPPDAPPDPQKRTPEQMQLAQKQRAIVAELSEQKILRAAYSEKQLEEVMTDFWFNHFNVFAGKGATQQYLTEYERDTIRPHVLGKFRDLLGATAKSPAMLFYLDNWQSADPKAGERMAQMQEMRRAQLTARGRGRFGMPAPPQGQRGRAGQPGQPNPNAQQRQRRGLNENYGRELMELHTLGVDGGYTQDDVVNVARAFTGWTIDQPRQGGSFRFEARIHDEGEKVVLGHRIAAGGGQSDGDQVLDILAKHPSTAHFIATKLVRRFVSDEPPKALVDRAAKRFTETGGDIREVVRTIITSKEFFAPDAYRAKVKSPFEFVVSTIRTTGSDVSDALPLVQQLRQLGMPLYGCQPPTGYSDRADAWVNTGALLNRMNFAVQLVGGRMRGVQAGSGSAAAALGGDISAATSQTIAKASDPKQVAALTLGSPEFQRK